jgi:hypothetical protein
MNNSTVKSPGLSFFILLRIIPARSHPWRGGRVVECNGLEIRHTGNRIEGSNPSFSATSLASDVAPPTTSRISDLEPVDGAT